MISSATAVIKTRIPIQVSSHLFGAHESVVTSGLQRVGQVGPLEVVIEVDVVRGRLAS